MSLPAYTGLYIFTNIYAVILGNGGVFHAVSTFLYCAAVCLLSAGDHSARVFSIVEGRQCGYNAVMCLCLQ
jgi:hypothetical protein